MGFVRGFTGGVTLTLGVAYLANQVHTRSRIAQSTSLRQQNSILETITKPQSGSEPDSDIDLSSPYSRTQRLTLSEAAKDRWNAEVSTVVHTLQTTDWEAVRDNAEAVLVALYRKATGTQAAHKVEDALKTAEQKVESKRADVASSLAERGGAVAASKAAVRDAVSAGIEKGKEVVDKVVGATKDAEKEVKKIAKDTKEQSEVEKALAQRYEQPKPSDKTAAQVLAERYRPVDQRDNTTLRGV